MGKELELEAGVLYPAARIKCLCCRRVYTIVVSPHVLVPMALDARGWTHTVGGWGCARCSGNKQEKAE